MARIMILTNSASGGGAERSMNILANSLFSQKFRVSITRVNNWKSDETDPMCEKFLLGRKWKSGFFSIFLTIYNFRKTLKIWAPTHLLVNCELPEVLSLFAPRKVKIIVIEHSSKPWDRREWLGIVIRRLLKIRRVSWVGVSENLKIWPTDELPKAVIRNSIFVGEEINSFSPTKQISRLLFIGRISYEKGADLFFNLVSELGIPALMIGDGNLKKELEYETKIKSLEILFPGQIENPWALVKNSDLLIVPSQFEGDGMVIVEAIKLGLKFLLRDNFDLRKFNLPELNYCTNQKEFIERIHELLTGEKNIYLPDELRSRIIIERDPLKITREWVSLIQSV